MQPKSKPGRIASIIDKLKGSSPLKDLEDEDTPEEATDEEDSGTPPISKRKASAFIKGFKS